MMTDKPLLCFPQTILVNEIGDQLGLDASEVMQAANGLLKKVSKESSSGPESCSSYPQRSTR